jgi:hypothetical protein
MRNDIYQISARIKNAAAASDHAFSPQGIALCNMFTHVIKELYDFSATIEDKEIAANLDRIIKRQENFPARLLDLFKPKKEDSIDEEDEIL